MGHERSTSPRALDGRGASRFDTGMYLHDTLLACPACGCHARSSAVQCPHCDAPLRNADGSRTRTAGAALLGLILVAAPAVGSCSGDVSVGSSEGTTGAGGGTTTTKMTGTGGHPVLTDYGAAVTTSHASSSSSSSGSSSGGFGGAQTDYGVPPTTTSSSSGTGGGH